MEKSSCQGLNLSSLGKKCTCAKRYKTQMPKGFAEWQTCQSNYYIHITDPALQPLARIISSWLSCIERARRKRSSPPSMSSTSCKTCSPSPTYVQPLTHIVLKTHKGFCQHEQRICRQADGMSFAHNVRPPPTRCSPTDSYTGTHCALGCCTVGAAALAHLARGTAKLRLCVKSRLEATLAQAIVTPACSPVFWSQEHRKQ